MGSLTRPVELPQGEFFPMFGLFFSANWFPRDVANRVIWCTYAGFFPRRVFGKCSGMNSSRSSPSYETAKGINTLLLLLYCNLEKSKLKPKRWHDELFSDQRGLVNQSTLWRSVKSFHLLLYWTVLMSTSSCLLQKHLKDLMISGIHLALNEMGEKILVC